MLDELVKPSIYMATVLRDSGELIQCSENIELPANCPLVTVDALCHHFIRTLKQRRLLLLLTTFLERAR